MNSMYLFIIDLLLELCIVLEKEDVMYQGIELSIDSE